MANFQLFQTLRGKLLTVRNDSRIRKTSIAYEYPSKHKLAQYAVTGCLNQTFYASAEAQLETVLALTKKVEPSLCRQNCACTVVRQGFMKDMPTLCSLPHCR